MYKVKTICIIIVFMSNYVLSTPMLYKRNPDDKYERDLVAVSSTVIPLTVLEVSYGLGSKLSEEDKEAYIKRLWKKVQHEKKEGEINENPDTLITIKKKHTGANDNAKVKGIITGPKSSGNDAKH